MRNKCDCYHVQNKNKLMGYQITGRPIWQHIEVGICYGTKEMDECSCGGDKARCDFYPAAVSIEDAMNHYKHGITHDIFSEPVISYAKLSIEALEKQIPKRPVYDLTYKVNCCPCCDSPFTFYGAYRTFKSETNFCPYCGQAIDWSE